jgi:hypothetical protein
MREVQSSADGNLLTINLASYTHVISVRANINPIPQQICSSTIHILLTTYTENKHQS